MAEVRLRNVSKSYDGKSYAVKDLDLHCPDGEMLALLGPSGCGKSSTLKIIAGIEQASEGAIYFGDVDVSRRDTARRNVAMVFEDYALYPHLTTYENIAFPLRVRGMPATEIAKRVSQALDLLRLGDLAEVQVRTLSGGAQQRVSIGRALVRDPALVMFDEPLSHLDSDQRIQLRTEIKRLQATAGLTSILVTHDQTEAVSMADRVAVMNHGVLQQVDTPQAIYDRPANLFVASFIGEPPMNFFRARLGSEGGRMSLTTQGTTFALGDALGARASAQGDVIVGIRPEHLVLRAASDAGAGDGALPVHGGVTDREPCGDRDILTVKTDWPTLSEHWLVEVAGPSTWRPGDNVSLALPPAKLHFFDAETGMNLIGVGS